MNILIADDNPTNLKLLQAMLEAEGHQVFSAGDGVEALKVLDHRKIEAVISDILMPRMDGYRFCLEVRKHEKFAALPFLFYTSTYISLSDAKAAMDLGADNFLKKPMPIRELLQAVQEAVRSAPQRQSRLGKVPEELGLMKEYNARLVAKLEKKNDDLQTQAESLRKSEAHKQAILDSALDAIITIDAQGKIVEFNPAAERTFGYSGAEALGRELAELLIPASGGPAYLREFERARSGDGAPTASARTELTAIRKNRVEFPLEFAMTRIAGSEPPVFTAFARDITERKRSQQQLLLQATALKAADNAIVITNGEGEILWVNPAFTALTGYAAEEVEGKNPRILQSGQHDRAFYQDLWSTILSGQTWRGQFTNRRKDGSLYFGEQTITPVNSEHGAVAYFVGIMNDVTRRKRAEEELRAAHTEMRHLLTHSPAFIYRLRIDGEKIIPVIVSDNIERLSGRPVAESNTFAWWHESLHPEDRDRVLATVAHGFHHGGYTIQYRIRHQDGSYRWVEDNNRVVREVGGRAVDAVGVWIDITERRQAEEALRQSEEQYRDLFENAHDLIQGVAPEGHLKYVNRAWRETLGYGEQNLHYLTWADLLHPDRREEGEELFRQALAGQRLDFVELDFISQDGKRIAVEGSVSARLVEGRIDSLLCIFRDVTEKKKLEAQFLRNQRMESIGTLAGGIAHDLNNALAPILMSLQVLQLKFTDPESAQMLEIITASAQRGADMVRQVLTFSRGLEGRQVEVQLNHLIREMLKIIRQTFPKTIAVQSNLANDLWTVMGDATQLHQVLLNLCVNARDAMPQGGVLSIKAENLVLDERFARMHPEAKPGPWAVLTVADTGTGMTPEVLARIFDPFFTTKPLGQGTGLGLSTVCGIVKSHGGFTNVYSEVGKGSAFKIHLPARSTGPQRQVEEALTNLPLGRGELILVVDDEAGVRSIARETLEMFGYRVLTAADGAQAAATCGRESGKIDLMLTDVMMPVMDGPAAIRAARAIDPQLKVIAASGLPFEDDAQSAEFKANAVLQKPYTAERLLKLVREVLDS